MSLLPSSLDLAMVVAAFLTVAMVAGFRHERECLKIFLQWDKLKQSDTETCFLGPGKSGNISVKYHLKFNRARKILPVKHCLNGIPAQIFYVLVHV